MSLKSAGSSSYVGTILGPIDQALENSWVRQLAPEEEANVQRSRRLSNLPDTDVNRNKRRVFNGHYVLVEPTGLPQPKLILYSKDVAKHLLKMTRAQVESDDFLQWVSGNMTLQETWATPYALAIMGERYTNNCPFSTGDGYGDGRAISIGELHGYELQLKGAGKTPFHRGADGRAVLRSSAREFLASEAMHWLGVPTTRALSLVVSGTETVQRPWYSESVVLKVPDMDDPRLQQFPPEQRRGMLRSMRNQKADPNILISEPCAITCRVAPSFVRIGHLDLFARRATSILKSNSSPGDAPTLEENNKDDSHRNVNPNASPFDVSTLQWRELEAMLWHACYREYRTAAYDPFVEKKDVAGAAEVFLERSADRISSMIGHWIRVGFTQGNFNADNCLVGGYTMDYGPFGFVEEYNPVFAKWVGSGQHYGFLNQPIAGLANYSILVMSIAPLICAYTGKDMDDVVDTWMMRAKVTFQQKASETFRVKLGFAKDNEAVDKLWEELEPLLRGSRVDWTLFWRQLTYVARDFPDIHSTDYEGMMSVLEACEGRDEDRVLPDWSPFYEKMSMELRKMWITWIRMWRDALKANADGSGGNGYYDRMRVENPKYVLREWMLVDAYRTASKGDYSLLEELHKLVQKPYDEGSTEQNTKYYKRASEQAALSGGVGFMS